MKTKSFILIAIIFLMSCQTNKQDIEQTASCIVSDSLAIAKIPITSENRYKYFKKSNPENVLEYSCYVSLDQYVFGFKLFKGPGYKEQKGSIERLISDGQSDITKIEGNTFSVVEGHGVSVEYAEPYFVMKISDKSTIDLLFKDNPSTCSFSVKGFKAPKLSGTIEIQYREF